MIKKLSTTALVLLLGVSSLHGGKGKIRVASDHEGAYVYVDGKKKAMTGEGFTSILLEEGEHNIKVIKPKDEYMGYISEKTVFVGEDTSVKLSFKLKLEPFNFKMIWNKTFGNKYDDNLMSIIQTKDGGFIAVGTKSKGHGESNGWIIRLDYNGNKIWDKTFGGKGDELKSIIQTEDGGFLAVGHIESKGHGDSDGWIIRLDHNGNKVWDKTFGGTKWDELDSIIQTKDGNYIASGYIMLNNKGKDGWVIKFNSRGNKIWDKTFGGTKWDELNSIIQTKDNGFVVVGSTESKGLGSYDGWIIKLDNNGNKVWDKTFGGKGTDIFYSVVQTKNGGFIIVGYIETNKSSDDDAWMIKLNHNGNKIWDKTFGGKMNEEDFFNSIIQTKDGEYIACGSIFSKNTNSRNAFFVKLNNREEKIWEKTVGGESNDMLFSIIQTKEGKYLSVGRNKSQNNNNDGWIIKFKK